jgi:Fur family ferric uptake transcriptional regulator
VKSNIKGKVERLLKLARLRQTGARTAVLGALFNTVGPQTAEQIIAKLVGKSPNKVTIYRTLESFVKAGFVHRVFIGERTQYFEMADHCSGKQCHPHFTCRKCGATRCLVGVSTPLVKGLGKGFILQRQQIRLEGICPACA